VPAVGVVGSLPAFISGSIAEKSKEGDGSTVAEAKVRRLGGIRVELVAEVWAWALVAIAKAIR